MTHDVHYLTARKDLNDLVERGFLEVRQDGPQKHFFVSNRIKDALNAEP